MGSLLLVSNAKAKRSAPFKITYDWTFLNGKEVEKISLYIFSLSPLEYQNV